VPRRRRNTERALYASGNATDCAANNAADSTPDWTCCLAPFPRSLACALLGATDDTLRTGRNRHRQNNHNCNPSRFHVPSPQLTSNGVTLAKIAAGW